MRLFDACLPSRWLWWHGTLHRHRLGHRRTHHRGCGMGAFLIPSSFLRSWDVMHYRIQAANVFFRMLTFWFVSQLSLSFFPLCRSFGLGLFIAGCPGSLLPSGLSLVARGGLLLVTLGLLVAVASLGEHRLQELWCMGLVGSPPTRNRTCVPCIGRWVLIHCTTREVPPFDFGMKITVAS